MSVWSNVANGTIDSEYSPLHEGWRKHCRQLLKMVNASKGCTPNVTDLNNTIINIDTLSILVETQSSALVKMGMAHALVCALRVYFNARFKREHIMEELQHVNPETQKYLALFHQHLKAFDQHYAPKFPAATNESSRRLAHLEAWLKCLNIHPFVPIVDSTTLSTPTTIDPKALQWLEHPPLDLVPLEWWTKVYGEKLSSVPSNSLSALFTDDVRSV